MATPSVCKIDGCDKSGYWTEKSEGERDPLKDAYFAGLFDGEGTIAAYSRPNRKLRPFVKINMTCRETIQCVADYFGGRVLVKKVYNGNKPQWHWVVTSNRAIMVVHSLLPYLVTKRCAAEQLLTTCSYGVQGSSRTLPASLRPDDPEVAALIHRWRGA